MKVTILGCGGSGGVPLVGGVWGDCNPNNPKNRRRRVSVLVEVEGLTILIDTSPDLRAQLLDAGVNRIDAILYTHDHADHVHGIDDLRFIKRPPDRSRIPAYGSADTLKAIQRRFPYIFQGEQGQGLDQLYEAILDPVPIESRTMIQAPSGQKVEIAAFAQDHGFGNQSTGYRIDKMAYSTDVVGLSETAFSCLHGVDLWVVDCLRWDPHPTHAHVDLALEWIARVKPKRAILTHMNTTLDYDAVQRRCPAGVEPGYDGLVVTL